MANRCYTPHSLDNAQEVAFASAEEAWFWYIRCQKIRHEGVRFIDSSSPLRRPCDPDDLYCAVIRLLNEGRLTSQHVNVLVRYGSAGEPPDARCREEYSESALWKEALDHLTTALRVKGIVS